MLCLVHRYLWKVPEHVYAAFKKQADAGSEKCLGAECCKVGKVQITAFLGSELGPDRGERNKQLRGLASLFDSLSSLAEWDKMFAAYKEKEPELAAQFERAVLKRTLPDNWDECLPKLTTEDKGKATRLHSQDCLNAIAPVLPEFMGGSADLAPSNMTLMTLGLSLRLRSDDPSLSQCSVDCHLNA
ncbi:tkt [Symbiodinium microadriaticum]|nr:tkt [Symbiodinium microadriaticum]